MPDIFVDKPQEDTSEPEQANAPTAKLDGVLDDANTEVKPPEEIQLPNPPVDPVTNPNPDSKPPSHMPHIFSAYRANPPKDVIYANREENEVLLLFLRRHLITNLPWILKALLFASVPILFAILDNYGLISITFLTPIQKAIIGFFYYFTVFSAYIFVNYLTWFYNISLVSNQRVIDIDFSNIVFEDVSATKLSQVEDVHYSQVGFSRSLFDYGDVLVQTAASTNEFEFHSIPHPEKVIRIINNLIGNAENA